MDRGEKIEEKLIAYIKIHIPLKEKFLTKQQTFVLSMF